MSSAGPGRAVGNDRHPEAEETPTEGIDRQLLLFMGYVDAREPQGRGDAFGRASPLPTA
jgi:hypothetical protein